MDRYLNYTAITLGSCFGFVASLFGGYDKYIKALVVVMILDFITGFIKSVYSKSLSSRRCTIGIFKKIMMLCIVCVSVLLEAVLSVPIRYVTIMFFVTNECISILENASVVIPLPKKLVDVIDSVRDKVPEADSKKGGLDE